MNLAGKLCYAAVVQPRHFLLVGLIASRIALFLTTFFKAHFGPTMLEINDLWAYVDNLERILRTMEAQEADLYELLVHDMAPADLTDALEDLRQLKLPRHKFCYKYADLITAFNWHIILDGGDFYGDLPYSSEAQLRYALQCGESSTDFHVAHLSSIVPFIP